MLYFCDTEVEMVRVLQDGACAICKKKKHLIIDANEDCVMQGLVCNDCFSGLSRFGRDKKLLLAAIEYLKLHPSWDDCAPAKPGAA